LIILGHIEQTLNTFDYMNTSETTFKTCNKDIPYITIGDKFVTNDGNIVEFVETNNENFTYDTSYPFVFKSLDTNHTDDYSIRLTIYENIITYDDLDIKCRYIPLKDKLNQI
jgi:hypothetical protein